MKVSFRILILSLMVLLVGATLHAENTNPSGDTLQISLLTCAPGKAPYEFYGHTALRVQNTASGQDLVFNYGVFDFDTPNFAWRFMTGQTDYTVGVSYFDSFAYSYQRKERSIYSQTLNLRPEEKARLYAALIQDWSTPNWTYRYNIVYDNCTTRAIGQIKKAVNGKMILPIVENGKRTFREILHEFSTENSPWYSFGEDLILGAELDHPIDVWKQAFSPIYAGKFMDEAFVMEADGSRRPLVQNKELIVTAITSPDEPLPLTPMMATVIGLFAFLGIAYGEYKKQQHFRIVDDVLMAVQGLVGCLVAFLFFVSEHPAVDTNWLILLLNPLPLMYLPVKIFRDKRNLKDYYHPVLGIALVLFAVTILLDLQKYPAAFYPLALILLTRVIMSWYFDRKKK